MSTPAAVVAALSKGQRPPAPGRRRRKPGGREKRVDVKLSITEHERLAALAAESGVSLPRFLIESAFADGVKPSLRRATITEFLAARNQVARAATNLNQLAKWANTHEAYPPGADRTAQALADALEHLNAAVDRIQL